MLKRPFVCEHLWNRIHYASLCECNWIRIVGTAGTKQMPNGFTLDTQNRFTDANRLWYNNIKVRSRKWPAKEQIHNYFARKLYNFGIVSGENEQIIYGNVFSIPWQRRDFVQLKSPVGKPFKMICNWSLLGWQIKMISPLWLRALNVSCQLSHMWSDRWNIIHCPWFN